MSLMVDENGITFKEIEKEIFDLICEAGRELTRENFIPQQGSNDELQMVMI